MSSSSINLELNESVASLDASEKYTRKVQLNVNYKSSEKLDQSLKDPFAWFKDQTKFVNFRASGNHIENAELSEDWCIVNRQTTDSQYNSSPENNEGTEPRITQPTSSILFLNDESDDDNLDEDSELEHKFSDLFDDSDSDGPEAKCFTREKANINSKYHERNDVNIDNDLYLPEWNAANALNFRMKPSYAALNQSETYSRKSKKYLECKKNVTTAKTKLDKSSRLLLNDLMKANVITKVNGIMRRGRKAFILHADLGEFSDSLCRWQRACVIKVFKPTLKDSKLVDQYIKEDCRFKDRFPAAFSTVNSNMWAEKEKLNIDRLKKLSIPCPHVMLQKKNVLVMSFLGYNRKPALKLKYARLSNYDLRRAYEEISKSMQTMYTHANLVHTDLSEYNILWHDWHCYFIDLAQAVDSSHPMALEFLMRDCERITSYFERCGLKVRTKEKLFVFVTAIKIESYKELMLEKMTSRRRLVP